MLIRSLSLAFGQLGDRAIIRVLIKSLLVTGLITLLLGFAIVWSWQALMDGINWGDYSWAADAASVIGVIGAILGVWLLFRGIAVPVVNFFADEIVMAVEAKHYPQVLASAKPMTVAAGVRIGLSSLGRFLLFNILAIPFYVFLLFTAIGPLILFIVINAVLLGRDLADTVAVRHMEKAAMRDWLASSKANRFLLGLIVTGLFTIPFANLFAPVLGAAAMTHLFHGGKPE